jgi:uncharacterized protein (DUF1810 family)
VHERALAELRAGAKRGHWMWFVFPQLAGLGSSPTARRYAISGLDEARAYAAHPLLGPRLVECCEALLTLDEGLSAERVLGPIDALKLRSCTTLFGRAAPGEPAFAGILDRFYDGAEDPATLRLLDAG